MKTREQKHQSRSRINAAAKRVRDLESNLKYAKQDMEWCRQALESMGKQLTAAHQKIARLENRMANQAETITTYQRENEMLQQQPFRNLLNWVSSFSKGCR
jgi:chromosome segregation ATPase